MNEVLNFLNTVLESIGLPYEFDTWTGRLRYPYFVGSIDSLEPDDEAGHELYMFTLSGWTRHSLSQLLEWAAILKRTFPPVGGRTAILESGSGIAVFYDTCTNVPTGEEDLKRVDIILQVQFFERN